MRRSFIFQAIALYPLLLKDKQRKSTNTELITEGWPVPESGLQASVMGLKHTSRFCTLVLRVQATLWIHGFREIAPWEMSSGSILILNDMLTRMGVEKGKSFRTKSYEELNG